MAKQCAHIIKTICTDWNFFKRQFDKSFIQKQLESIDLSARNETFVTKGEIENKFLTTPTEEPKLNHWVDTTLNQEVIKFKPSSK